MSGTDPVTPVFPAGSGPSRLRRLGPGPVHLPDQQGCVQGATAGRHVAVRRGKHCPVRHDFGRSLQRLEFRHVTVDVPRWVLGLVRGHHDRLSNSAGINTDLIESVLYLNGSVYQECSGDWGVNGHATGSSGSVPISLYGGQDAISGSIFSSAAVGVPTTNGQYPSIEVCWLCL